MPDMGDGDMRVDEPKRLVKKALVRLELKGTWSNYETEIELLRQAIRLLELEQQYARKP
jgi:hypothetical protein